MHILDVYIQKIGNKLVELSEAIKKLKELMQKVEWESRFSIGRIKDITLPEIDEMICLGDAILSVKLMSYPRKYELKLEIKPSKKLEQEVRNSIPQNLGNIDRAVFSELAYFEAMKEALKDGRLEKALETIFVEYEELLKYLKEKIDEIKKIFAREIVAKEI